ncbi:MAG TPA: ATP-binding cassette domain-containing protein, partial [Salinarimonas sp.]|nr:ATP-binding cassette domain-containing protein [Salinarimonas sp.]
RSFSLFEAMTVAENVALGLDHAPSPRRLAPEIRRVAEDYGLPLDPDRDVHTLSVGERQRIEIVRALLQKPRLLIMDEPTSVLTPQEVGRLFATLRRLSAEGCSILYISHKLNEIIALCEAATILRGGRVVAACDPRRETAGSMAQMMIGAELRAPARRAGGGGGAPRLVVEGLDLPAADAHGVALKGVALEVRAGEIVGVAGVAGNGQGELEEALAGERLCARAEAIRIDGRAAGRLGPDERREAGLCVVPEERNGHGAVPGLTLVENAILSAHHRRGLVAGGLIRFRKARAFAAEIVRRFDVRTPGVDAAASNLSGGNLQKFVVGREILQDPGVLVVSQPTWGVDAGAAAAIHEALVRLAGEGAAVLVISQDLDELLVLCDRLAVINVGALSPARPTGEVSVEEIGLLMGGVHGVDPGPAGAAHAL